MKDERRDREGGEVFFARDTDPLWHSLLMGTCSGVTCVVVGHPLDTVKVRLQTSAKGPLFRNLFRGIVPPVLAVTPSWIGVFLMYGGALKMIGSNDLSSVALAGGISGTAYSIVMCPFEMIKVNSQRSQVSALVASRKLYASVGFRGLYRGFGACLARDISQSAVYYVCAEYLNRSSDMQKAFGSATPLVAGGITGVAHELMAFSFDTVKSRFQTSLHMKSYRECIHGLMRPGELKRAGTALLPVVVRAVIAHSCSFFAVQKLKNRFLNYQS